MRRMTWRWRAGPGRLYSPRRGMPARETRVPNALDIVAGTIRLSLPYRAGPSRCTYPHHPGALALGPHTHHPPRHPYASGTLCLQVNGTRTVNDVRATAINRPTGWITPPAHAAAPSVDAARVLPQLPPRCRAGDGALHLGTLWLHRYRTPLPNGCLPQTPPLPAVRVWNEPRGPRQHEGLSDHF